MISPLDLRNCDAGEERTNPWNHCLSPILGTEAAQGGGLLADTLRAWPVSRASTKPSIAGRSRPHQVVAAHGVQRWAPGWTEVTLMAALWPTQRQSSLALDVSCCDSARRCRVYPFYLPS